MKVDSHVHEVVGGRGEPQPGAGAGERDEVGRPVDGCWADQGGVGVGRDCMGANSGRAMSQVGDARSLVQLLTDGVIGLTPD